MRARVMWTPWLDNQLKALRWDGMTWEEIAREMGLGRNTVHERGRRIGARRAWVQIPGSTEEAPDRPARAPGHPASWDLINAGTVLEGVPYPYPVFL